MSDKAFKNTLTDIISTLSKHESIIKDSQSGIKTNTELLNNIYERVEDMGKKLDFFINMGGHTKKPKPVPVKKNETAKPKKPTKKSAETTETTENKSSRKVIKNIMTYFKTRYTEDQNYFNDIFEEKQIEALFAEHEKDLNAKKGINKIKAQSNILYKSISDSQRKKIREKMTDENDAASINNDDDIEEETSD